MKYDQDIARSIGGRLRYARGGRTQDEIARVVGKNTSTVRNWESGRTHPSDAVLRVISEYTGFNFDWLKSGFGSPEPPKIDLPFSRILKALRLAHGIGYRELAGRVGVTDTMYLGWEQGRYEPRITHLYALSDVLQVPIVALLDEAAAEHAVKLLKMSRGDVG